MYYHLGQCLACSDTPPSRDFYKDITQEISRFLKGGHQKIKQTIQEKMYQASEDLNFERAKELRDQLTHIDSVMEQQKMTLEDRTDRDIFNFSYDKGWMCVQVFFIRQGKLIERDVSIFPFFDEPTDVFTTFVGRFYLHQNHLKPKQILVPAPIEYEMLKELLKIDVTIPYRGRKKELIDLAGKNAEIALSEKFQLIERNEERTIKAVETLGDILQIDTPHRIEAFDNSNIQGPIPLVRWSFYRR